MFVLILDSVENFHTVEERRLHRIFGGLEASGVLFWDSASVPFGSVCSLLEIVIRYNGLTAGILIVEVLIAADPQEGAADVIYLRISISLQLTQRIVTAL